MTFTVGMRVQTHPATDAWMRGDRYGTVTRISTAPPSALHQGLRIHVKLDRSGRTLRFRADDVLSIDDVR